MSCCGSRRRQFQPTPPARAIAAPPPAVGPATGRQPVRAFVYEGLSAVMIVGQVTGRRYYFGQAGAQMAIDPRDAPGLKGKPVVRRS